MGRTGVDVDEVRVARVVEFKSSHTCAFASACSVVAEEDRTSLKSVSRSQSRTSCGRADAVEVAGIGLESDEAASASLSARGVVGDRSAYKSCCSSLLAIIEKVGGWC